MTPTATHSPPSRHRDAASPGIGWGGVSWSMWLGAAMLMVTMLAVLVLILQEQVRRGRAQGDTMNVSEPSVASPAPESARPATVRRIARALRPS